MTTTALEFVELKCHKCQDRKCSEHDVHIYGSINNVKVESWGQEVTQEVAKVSMDIQTNIHWVTSCI